jgi:hypothetical protein
MTWTFAVTFESDTQPPETIRGTVEAGSFGPAASRAAKAAKRQHHGRRFRSVVILLERAEPAGSDEG